MSFNNHDNGYPNINNYFNDPNIQTNMRTAQNLQDALNRYAPPNYVNINVLVQHFYLRL